MKKMKLLLAAIMLLSLAACTGTETNTSTVSTTPVKEDTMAGYPAWVIDPSVEDGIGAVGSAFIGAAGVSFARTEALANARDELARQMEVKVQNMFKSYTNSIGLGGADGVEKVATSVSKQIANQTIKGSKQKGFWISPDKELFVQVIVAEEVVKEEAKEIMKSDVPVGTSDRALWQEFKSKNAQEELDKAIDEMLQ